MFKNKKPRHDGRGLTCNRDKPMTHLQHYGSYDPIPYALRWPIWSVRPQNGHRLLKATPGQTVQVSLDRLGLICRLFNYVK